MPISTPPRDDEPVGRKGSRTATSFFGLTLLAMIAAGLIGTGFTDFGTSFDTAVKVGDTEVDAQAYARALSRQINQVSNQFGTQLTFQQAQMFGLDQQVLQTLVADAALAEEARRLGVSASDMAVARIVAETQAFRDVTGKFDRTNYQLVLERNNFTIASYEQSIREDLSRQILQAAVAAGQTAPQALVRTLYAQAAETRGFTFLPLTEANLPQPLAEPTADEVKAWYEANIADFTRPEGKRVAYALLATADLAQTMGVDEAAIRAAYDAASDTYNIPEKRLVERLVYPSAEEAAAAAEKLAQGTSFDALVTERGLELDDVDMGDVAQVELGAAGAAVFALAEPGVTGVLDTDLGPAIFRVNAILPAQITPFEEAAVSLRETLAREAAVKAVADRQEPIDDLLAEGASVSEVAKAQGMTEGTTDFAPGAEDNDPLTADPAFAQAVTAMEPGDFAQMVTLEDGSLMVLQVTEALPAAPIPLDQAEEKVRAAVRANALTQALKDLAAAHLTAVQGGASMESLGITTRAPSVTRTTVPDGVPAEAVARTFTLTAGEVVILEAPDTVALLRLDSVTPADLESDRAKQGMDALAGQIETGLANDIYGLYSNALTNELGLTIDQAVIASVQSRM